MNTKNPWIVGGDRILQQYIVSRLARPSENVSAREYVMQIVKQGKGFRQTGRVKIFQSEEKAQLYADRNNKFK